MIAPYCPRSRVKIMNYGVTFACLGVFKISSKPILHLGDLVVVDYVDAGLDLAILGLLELQQLNLFPSPNAPL